MSGRVSELGRLGGVIAIAGVIAGGASCESLIGADFDVEPRPEGGGAGGDGSSSSASASSTGSVSAASGSTAAGATAASTGSTGAGGGGSGGGSATCPDDPVLLATDQTWALGIAVDDTHVYWTNGGVSQGSVARAEKASGSNAQVLAMGQSRPNRIVIAGDFVVWNETGDAVADGAIHRTHRDTLGLETIADGLRLPIGLATDGQHVYFTTSDDGESAPAAVHRFEVLAAEAPSLFAEVPQQPVMLATGDGTLFGASYAGDAAVVWRVATSDAAPATIEPFDQDPMRPDAAMAFGGGVLAVSSFFTGTVTGYSLAGIEAFALATLDEPADVKFHDGWFYIAESGGDSIWRVRPDGTSKECVVTGQTGVNGLAVDDTHVYFTRYQTNGSVRSIPH